MATSQPCRCGRSARIGVWKFAPTAMAPPSAFRRGRLDTARTVSTMVPLPRRAVLLMTDSCCLKRIVVCDMPDDKSYSRCSCAALRYRPMSARNKKPRKTGAFYDNSCENGRDYMRALSNLILRVRTAADRHSWRRSGHSSSENCQQKQRTGETDCLKRHSLWKQSWTWKGPFRTDKFSACIALRYLNLRIPDTRSNSGFCIAALSMMHRNIAPPCATKCLKFSPIASTR